MAFTAAQLQIIKTEIINDPRGYGYASLVALGADNAIADILNKVRDGSDGFPAITRKRQNITPDEILLAIDTRDYKASPSVLEAAHFESMLQADNAKIRLFNDDGTETMHKKNLDRLVNSTNGSQARVNALGNQSGSRAEELLNVTGIRVSADDVTKARMS